MVGKDRVLILYGSQTGTAQELAENIWRQSRYRNICGPIMAMDDYKIEELVKERFVIFVCSTTGLGEEPDNMKKFWRFLLRKRLPSNSLSNLKFGVLGLGDSSYSKFNFPAKKLHKRLLQLGGTSLLDIGLCDYQHDLGNDAVFEPWIGKLWQILAEYLPGVDTSVRGSPWLQFIPRWKINSLKEQTNTNDQEECQDLYYSGTNLHQFTEKPFLMYLNNNTRTTSDSHFQDVRLLKFKSCNNEIEEYEPGDVFNIRPRNSKSTIDDFFAIFGNLLNLHSDDTVEISQHDPDMPVPYFFQKPVKLGQIVEEYWDLSAIPKKYAFSVLAHYSENKLEKEKCQEFCTPEGQDDLLNYCNRPRRTILEVLKDFPYSTSKLTFDSLFELFTVLKPRAFSIASSSKARDNSNVRHLEILVAVVNYYTKLKIVRLGVCSNWLKDMEIGTKVYGWIKKGTFEFPKDENTPLIMIGPGTGVAPFRSLIMEKDICQKASDEKLILFFGCRYEHKDFHCGKYFKELEANKKLRLICAFSRDQENKVYVQHKINEQKQLLWQMINEKNAVVFVAGTSKNMPDSVKESFIENVFMAESGMTKDDADAFLQQMENSGRLQLETW